ncbi:MAG: hypothetical protein NC311_09755 [Muribaculaceae bacterium]|nr:hypothetical protein [Muribaculaceae bacterium]
MEERIYVCVQTLIEVGDTEAAQQMLDDIEEKDARWHYLSSRVYLAKNWTNESRKQLEIAIELDPENEKYKEELQEMKNVAENESGEEKSEMGKRKFRDNCCECCSVCCQICGDGCPGC